MNNFQKRYHWNLKENNILRFSDPIYFFQYYSYGVKRTNKYQDLLKSEKPVPIMQHSVMLVQWWKYKWSHCVWWDPANLESHQLSHLSVLISSLIVNGLVVNYFKFYLSAKRMSTLNFTVSLIYIYTYTKIYIYIHKSEAFFFFFGLPPSHVSPLLF